jgi:hypothetical protein
MEFRRIGVPLFVIVILVLSSGSDCNNNQGEKAAFTRVTVDKFALRVHKRGANGELVDHAETWDMKGIAWSPYKDSGPQADGTLATGSIPIDTLKAATSVDLEKMKAASINTVRTYQPFDSSADHVDDSKTVLQSFYDHGIMVAMTVYAREADGEDDKVLDKVKDIVRAFKNQPAVLLWIVGNEVNLNCLHKTCDETHTVATATTKINAVVAAIKAEDPNHPVAVGWSDCINLPALNADLWALNLYPDYKNEPGKPHQSFRNECWAVDKPFFISEYGVDAFDNVQKAEDETEQQRVLTELTGELRAHLSAKNSGPCIGGCPFAWSDEPWKAAEPVATPCADAGIPLAKGKESKAARDQCFNEAYFGIVKADRTPRTAYQQLKQLYEAP